MEKILKYCNKYFWIISFIIYFLFVSIAFWHIWDFYFHAEDFLDIQNLLFGSNQLYPYQGVKYLLYPFFWIFGNQPQGYFLSAYFLYSFLPLFLEYVVYSITKKKGLAFFSALYFSTGYVGSMSLTFIESAIPGTIYLYLLLGILILYQKYFSKSSTKYYLATILLFLFALSFLTHRASSLLLLLIVADTFLISRKTAPIKMIRFNKMVKRILPFLIIFIGVYFIYPILSNIDLPRFLGILSPAAIGGPSQIRNCLMVFLTNISGYLLPSLFLEKTINFLAFEHHLLSFTTLSPLLLLPPFFLVKLWKLMIKGKTLIKSSWTILYFVTTPSLILFSKGNIKLFVGSYIGFLILYSIIGFVVVARMEDKIRRLLYFFFSLWLISYLMFTVHEPAVFHASPHLYLFFCFPFFTTTVAIVFLQLPKLTTTRSFKYFLFLSFLFIIFLNSYAALISPFKKDALARGRRLKNFVSSLKTNVPYLSSDQPSLFYFDFVNNEDLLNIFTDTFFSGGLDLKPDISLFYKIRPELLTITSDYDTFAVKKKQTSISNSYAFFYDINYDLHFINNFDNDQGTFRNKNLLKETTVALYNSCAECNSILNSQTGPTVNYLTKLRIKENLAEFSNDTLELGLTNLNIPSFKPLELTLTLKIRDLTVINNLGRYKDISVPDSNDCPTPMPPEYLQLLPGMQNYLRNKATFEQKVSVRSSVEHYAFPAKNSVDGNLKTSWKAWFGDKDAWLEIRLPEKFHYQAISWTSADSSPNLYYEYQIKDQENGNWKTVFKTNREVIKNEKIFDELPQESSFFRIVFPNQNISNPAISEMELLNTKNPQLPRYATSLLSHPFCRASDREIINVIKDYFTLTVYPISDKYLFKSSSLPIKQRVFLDGQSHTYSFKLPAGGTHLDKVLIEFPGLPISATIEGFELSQM